MPDPRTIHTSGPRVETGPVRFVYEDGYRDWTAMLLRGDDAMQLRWDIADVLHWIDAGAPAGHRPSIALAALAGFVGEVDTEEVG